MLSNFSFLPYKTLAFLFLMWSNSKYAPVGKHAGFYCDDESIKKPYSGDTIRLPYLSAVTLFVIPMFIYLTEYFVRNSEAARTIHGNVSPFSLFSKYYFSGFVLVAGFTEILKFSCCELRPHFFYTCLPDMKNIDCSEGLIKNFNCTGDGPDWLIQRDIYKSFPSGHASFSFYSFVFIAVYVILRMKNAHESYVCRWGKRCIPLLSFLWTLACCITRVLDYRHFWWDVLSGVVIGLVGGLAAVLASFKAFEKMRVIDSDRRR